MMDSIDCHENVFGKTTHLMDLFTVRVALENPGAILLEAQKQFNVSDDAALQGFVESGAKLASGECAQYRRIDHHRVRLVKRADEILAEGMVDADLAPNRRIDLSQEPSQLSPIGTARRTA